MRTNTTLDSISAISSDDEAAWLAQAARTEPEVIVQAGRAGLSLFELGELWAYHELLYFLVWRDLKVRYKQAILGVSWAIVQPVLSVVVFTLFFGKFGHLPSDHVPYPLFCLAGMLLWTYFANSINKGISSILGNAHLITKVYFPRILIPAAAVVSSLVDYAIGTGVLVALLIYYHVLPSALGGGLFFIFTLATSTLAFGLSLWLCALTAKYRDFSHLLPFLLQIWMFATPILYPLSIVPERHRWLAELNPVAGLVEGMRSSLFGTEWHLQPLLFSGLFTLTTLITGAWYFRRTERTLADII